MLTYSLYRTYAVEPVVQLIPGILLAIGSFMLPPSPRFLVARGRTEEAESVLMKLRKASGGLEELVQVCVTDNHTRLFVLRTYIQQIELLEMRVEASLTGPSDPSAMKNPIATWVQVFEPKFRKQTLLGVATMFFQRTCAASYAEVKSSAHAP